MRLPPFRRLAATSPLPLALALPLAALAGSALAGTAIAAPPAKTAPRAAAKAPATAKAAPRPAPLASRSRAAPNWLVTVAATAGGGHRLGNPAAPVQLIEFVSYTCPHCSDFQQQAGDRLKLGLVAPGKGAVEVRHVVRDPVDLVAALAADCGPAANFFANHAAIMGAQDAMLTKLQLALPTQKARWTSGGWGSRARAIAADAGLYALMEPRGYSRTVLDQCITDEGAARLLAQHSNADAARWGVEYTPSFALGDKLLADTHDWPALSRRLDAAGD